MKTWQKILIVMLVLIPLAFFFALAVLFFVKTK